MPSVLAIFAHPDDIEFVAAGTLLLLRDRGWTTHYMNVANGCCGSTITDREQTAAIRTEESKSSANLLGASYYPPICDDLDVFFNRENLAKIAAVIRLAKPDILLTHSPVDYMEDHMETCRLAITAAFAKGVPNFATTPSCPSIDQNVAIYHAQPHGNRTPFGEPVIPNLAIPIDSVMERKHAMLACHQSQQQWLQTTQGMNSYCQTMQNLCREVAQISKCNAEYAEGWRQHSHLGFATEASDPLRIALGL